MCFFFGSSNFGEEGKSKKSEFAPVKSKIMHHSTPELNLLNLFHSILGSVSLDHKNAKGCR